MKKIFSEAGEIIKNKIYLTALLITTICSYGFAITHPSIGIDDTAMELYLEEGLNVEVGRWVLYILNKFLNLSKFSPFITELLGAAFLMAAAILFCVLLNRIMGKRLGTAAYIIFSCLFVSNPIISFDFIYYLHNGVGMGYIFTALALLFYYEGLTREGRGKIKSLVASLLFIWTAAGCYESFLVLYILGILVILFFSIRDQKSKYFMISLELGAAIVVCVMILRSAMQALLTVVFHIYTTDSVIGLHSMQGMLRLFGSKEGLQELFMLAKRFWVVYHVNAIVYLPITGYELACWVFGIYAVSAAVRKKNLWYLLLFLGMLFTPFLLTIIEAKVTFYRSCQYMPFFTAVGMVLLYEAFPHGKISVGKISIGKISIGKYKKYWRFAISAVAFVFIYNQATQLNDNFYMDYREYQLTKETLLEVAYDVERQYGNDIPVVFVGQYDIPYEFIKDFYVSYDSWQYKLISMITDVVDVHLKEKYWQPQGYCFIGEANLPMIRWAFDAFDGTNREMIRFLEMHGHSFTTLTDAEEYTEIRNTFGSLNMPRYPQEGSIVMQDGYVVVNF